MSVGFGPIAVIRYCVDNPESSIRATEFGFGCAFAVAQGLLRAPEIEQTYASYFLAKLCRTTWCYAVGQLRLESFATPVKEKAESV